jgi:hypothetical protein
VNLNPVGGRGTLRRAAALSAGDDVIGHFSRVAR